jgi:ribosomal-protein-alanine N-acetyltransferase
MSAQRKPSWQLLPMQQSHLPQILTIERRGYEFPWSEGIFRDCLRAGYSGWVLCDEHDFVLAYCLLSMAVDEAHVLNLCVDPGGQRRGMGTFLLLHMIKIARAANATIVLLEVRTSNRTAIRLYEGYYPARDGREDALVLGYDIA